MADLDGDGHVDLISGSWPGEIFFFKGGPGRTFAAPIELQDKDGNFINIGGGIEEKDGEILITGNAEFEKTPEGTVAVYHGKRIPAGKGKRVAITGTASAVHAVDWDQDGDLDLLVGEIGGSVHLIPNEGTAKAWAFGKEQAPTAGGKPIHVDGDAGPSTADWDGDGDFDLLVGAGDGSVTWFRNEADRDAKHPALAAGVTLVPKGEAEYGPDAPKEPRRGIRAKVCAADWNGDGRLDLLLGDMATQKPDLPEPTPEEKVEHDRLRTELAAARDRYRALTEKLYGARPIEDEAGRAELEAAMKTAREEMTALQKKLPREYENHGWVWLFLRKPADSVGKAR